MTSICDLPAELVGQAILSRVPITSLRVVRSTCKLWDAITKEWVLGKAVAAREQFWGFMTKDSKVCSVRFNLCRSKDKEDKDEDFLDLSIKQVDLLNQVDISQVFHCDGLLLCVAKDKSKLVVWNPYLGQTVWIRFITDFNIDDSYALGYDIKRNRKILRCLGYVKKYEIYDFSSNSWRALNVTSNCLKIGHYDGGVSLKGNTYFFAHKIKTDQEIYVHFYHSIFIIRFCMPFALTFLVCFDFTTERFGPVLPLPFQASCEDTVAISCVREEKLAVLYQQEVVNNNSCNIVHIWVTTTIEPNFVSWSMFLKVEMKPSIWFNNHEVGTFFIDEKENFAVVFDIDKYHLKNSETVLYHTAFVIGEGGYFNSVSLGVAPRYFPEIYCPPRLCSSYRPSLVQVNQLRKRKERDG